ncbi:Rha family transcriptional regulator [Campylobacter coli]|uniref:Rha family transcriptional regulator n=1 Tax=Campylobacter coli TaxID=195 RepID=UPI001A8EC1BD|nr:Rha family transcriptional regulator [Campylobacter coli]MBN9679464.1 Rha family transcriptional regulator [Campylobacter coli]MCD4857108.1 Rha family transcriptional regulator [Campylobacter coli]MCD4857888.1 Rha family transcriptional regulator [Campylobacter coli]MCD4861975.1 Rha family transcriptional regulator [Campylobacter coli]
MSNAPVIINNVEVNLNIKENKVFINSLDLAKVFNKNHKDVLETTKNQPQNDFTESNFILSTYKDKKGELRPCYNLTRDGFSLLVMGFTGEKAYKWKVEFIKAFNEMEKRLRNIEYEKHDKLAFRQSLGYKSQLKQQKEHYENKIKALKYDLEKKKELSFKRKLSKEELLELRKILAKDYDIVCFKEWEYMLFAESVSGKNYKLEKENDFCIYKSIKDSFNSKLDYYKNYEEYEEKWRKILRR